MAERKSTPAPTPGASGGRRGAGLFTGVFIGILLGIAMALAVAVWLNVRGSPFSEREAPVDLPPLQPPAAAVRPPASDDGATGGGAVGADAAAPDAAGLGTAGPGTPGESGSGRETPAQRPESGRGGQRFDFYEILPGKGAANDPAGESAQPPRINLPMAFFLQAGAFRNPADADDRKAHLALLGQSAVVQRVEAGGGVLHRIRVGPFATQAELDRARAFLSSNGIESIPLRPEATPSQ